MTPVQFLASPHLLPVSREFLDGIRQKTDTLTRQDRSALYGCGVTQPRSAGRQYFEVPGSTSGEAGVGTIAASCATQAVIYKPKQTILKLSSPQESPHSSEPRVLLSAPGFSPITAARPRPIFYSAKDDAPYTRRNAPGLHSGFRGLDNVTIISIL